MERQNGYDNSLELMLLNLGGKVNEFAKSGDDPNQLSITHDPNQANNALSLPHSFRSNFYEFLTENSSLVPKAPTHVFDTISAPVSDPCSIQAMSEFQTQILMYHNPGLASASKSSLDMDAWKFNPQFYMFNSDNHQPLSLQLKFSEQYQYDEVNPLNKFNSSQDQTQTQIHSSFTQEQSGGATRNVSRTRPRRKAAPSVILSNPCHNVTRQRVSSTDRKRREKIAGRVKALQELLPQSVQVQGSQAAAMDEIIEYVKYLQLQMKELSRSKLGVEMGSCPCILNEGQGQGDHHDYSFHGQTMNEPLEETLAKLLKVDKSAAFKFLESKGLYVMPMALAHSLQ